MHLEIPMRTRIFILSIIVLVSVLVVLNIASVLHGHHDHTRGAHLSQLTKSLQLTDLAIWTESRYTRHPSQADRFSAFQDIPAALERFPAGSLVVPPSMIVAFEKTDFQETRQ